MLSYPLMRSIFLIAALCSSSAIAEETTPQTPASTSSSLEMIQPTTAQDKDCPMHKGQEKCEHKAGEPCTHHKDEKPHAKSHDHCDHKQHDKHNN